MIPEKIPITRSNKSQRYQDVTMKQGKEGSEGLLLGWTLLIGVAEDSYAVAKEGLPSGDKVSASTAG